MFQAFIVSSVLLLLGILILGFRIFFIKGGTFPNIHIGGNKALKEKGVECATSQDRDAQKKSKTQSATQMVDNMINNF
ncbi:hypothetical protein SDC9_150281 [bioreactor metagenome]|uniref:Uncharacterized protein n=1 Tax=bioreactor metagenome TaxID=1076179 RepID=A0A645EM10_9ZZZZ|nr:hypothetical protein [Paludibacter sp.]